MTGLRPLPPLPATTAHPPQMAAATSGCCIPLPRSPSIGPISPTLKTPNALAPPIAPSCLLRGRHLDLTAPPRRRRPHAAGWATTSGIVTQRLEYGNARRFAYRRPAPCSTGSKSPPSRPHLPCRRYSSSVTEATKPSQNHDRCDLAPYQASTQRERERSTEQSPQTGASPPHSRSSSPPWPWKVGRGRGAGEWEGEQGQCVIGVYWVRDVRPGQTRKDSAPLIFGLSDRNCYDQPVDGLSLWLGMLLLVKRVRFILGGPKFKF